MQEARDAADFFARSRSPAAEFRARLEEVYAIRRTLNGPGCLARAEPLSRKLASTQYVWLQARLAVERAECENLAGAFAEANTSLNSSREISTRFGFSVLALRDTGLAAGNLRLRGDCDGAWQQTVAGLSLYWQQAFTPPDPLYQFYSVMYQCALQDGALYAGEAFLRHAITMRENSPEIKKNRNVEGLLHLQLAHVLDARGVTQEARREYQKSSELLPPGGLPKKFKLILELEPAEFQLRQGNARQALATLGPLRRLLVENPDSFFSLRYYEIQAMAQLQSGQLEEAAASYQKAISVADSALSKIDDGRERLQWLRATDESYRGLVRVLLEQKKTQEALEAWELYRSKPLLDARFTPQTAGIAAQKRTSTNAGNVQVFARDMLPRIIYAEFTDGIQIWVSRRGEIRSQWVKIDKQDIDNPTRQFIELCSTESSKLNDVQALGARLFGILLQPVISELPASGDLIVELDPSAYNLPMEALRSPEGKYFGESYSVVYSPGIWMERELRSPLPITGNESLTLVDASHTGKAGYLPGFATQKEMIARLFPKTYIIDSSTTDWSIAQTRLSSSQLFHYMGHGRPDGSGTSLDYDAHRSLRAYDFLPNQLTRTELVVLAACSGAAGREYGLADTSNLVRVFLRAGVTSIVASHWNVDAASTSRLIEDFYLHLAKKESVARAMYNARIDMLHANPHPYFWAGFGLSGRAS
jgi:CHAT domain-containing protein